MKEELWFEPPPSLEVKFYEVWKHDMTGSFSVSVYSGNYLSERVQ